MKNLAKFTTFSKEITFKSETLRLEADIAEIEWENQEEIGVIAITHSIAFERERDLGLWGIGFRREIGGPYCGDLIVYCQFSEKKSTYKYTASFSNYFPKLYFYYNLNIRMFMFSSSLSLYSSYLSRNPNNSFKS